MTAATMTMMTMTMIRMRMSVPASTLAPAAMMRTCLLWMMEKPSVVITTINLGVPMQCQLVFKGLSQEQDTPPEAGDAAIQKPAIIFSPTTLNRPVNEVGVAPLEPADKKKKARKRKPKTAPGASMSQPAQNIRHDSVIPPRPDGLTRVHEAGKPILPENL